MEAVKRLDAHWPRTVQADDFSHIDNSGMTRDLGCGDAYGAVEGRIEWSCVVERCEAARESDVVFCCAGGGGATQGGTSWRCCRGAKRGMAMSLFTLSSLAIAAFLDHFPIQVMRR